MGIFISFQIFFIFEDGDGEQVVQEETAVPPGGEFPQDDDFDEYRNPLDQNEVSLKKIYLNNKRRHKLFNI